MTKNQSLSAKGAAACMILITHLFNHPALPYRSLVTVNGEALAALIALPCAMCVYIFAFLSGYAQYRLFCSAGPAYRRSRWRYPLRLWKRYWLIAAVYAAAGLCTAMRVLIPGSVLNLILNLFLIRQTYLSPAWYVLTYTLLILLSPLLCSFVQRRHPALTLTVFGSIHLLVHLYIRFVNYTTPVYAAQWCIDVSVRLGQYLFTFVSGALACRLRVIDRMNEAAWKPILRLPAGILFMAFSFVLLLVERSNVIMPIGAVLFLGGLFLLPPARRLGAPLRLLGRCSTDVWLTHCIFYGPLMYGFVYCAVYPVPIFFLMLALSLGASGILHLLQKIGTEMTALIRDLAKAA